MVADEREFDTFEEAAGCCLNGVFATLSDEMAGVDSKAVPSTGSTGRSSLTALRSGRSRSTATTPIFTRISTGATSSGSYRERSSSRRCRITMTGSRRITRWRRNCRRFSMKMTVVKIECEVTQRQAMAVFLIAAVAFIAGTIYGASLQKQEMQGAGWIGPNDWSCHIVTGGPDSDDIVRLFNAR